MVYLEIKTINGREYRYERRSYRIGSVVKHTSKYIEPVRPLKSRAGRKPTLRVNKFSKKEKDFVKQNLRNSKSFIKDRARIIQLSSEGRTVKQVCQKLGFHRPKVEKVIKQFNEKGLNIFERGKSPGRPRRIAKEERAKIIQFLNTKPEKLGFHFTNWSQKKLAEYAREQGIEVSQPHIGRIIKQDEIKYKKKTRWLYSNDPDFAGKKIKD